MATDTLKLILQVFHITIGPFMDIRQDDRVRWAARHDKLFNREIRLEDAAPIVRCEGDTFDEALHDVLVDAFGTADFYTLMAAQSFKKRVSEVTAEERHNIKQAFFLMTYSFPDSIMEGIREAARGILSR